MAITNSGQFDDVNNDNYLAGSITATTSQTEVKVGASKLEGRELVIIENRGLAIVYVGPSGVTSSNGIRLVANQNVTLPIGDSVAIFVVTAAGSATVMIQEVA